MDDKFPPDFPSRVGQPRDRLFEVLVEKLLHLQERSDPMKGAATEEFKDADAFRALQCAGDLVQALAGGQSIIRSVWPCAA